MIGTNATSLVKISVAGEIDNPRMPPLPANPYLITAEGKPIVVPTFGGLVYNVRVGDPALGWQAELIQPGVSVRNQDPNANTALGVYACVGNRVTVTSGAADGATGTVIGKSGRFANQVICDFDPDDLEQMSPGDKVQVQAHGVGLKLDDFPSVDLKSCSPRLLEALNLHVNDDGDLVVPVKGVAPNYLVGAGAGFNPEKSPISLQTSDPEALADSGLTDLRFGDIVAVTDWDSRFSHGFLRGRAAVGVVCQGGSFRSGYGPGMVVFLTAEMDVLRFETSDSANIVELLGLH
jgi:hypothetical protein